MASRPDEDLSCPVCHGIFQEPVLLSCGHSFCRACLQTWWTHENLMCPVCRRTSLSGDPPQNLALRNLCEDFLKGRCERPSAGSASLCSLHSEELKLFCQTHQQPVCLICLHSETHKNHSFVPVNEAVQDYKVTLQELLKPLQEKLELCNDIKETFDQTEKDIEAQAQDAEKQIKDVISMFQKILQKEEQTRIAAVQEEKQQKIQVMKRNSEALSKETEALSDTIRATEETLRAEDLTFLQNYRTAAEKVQCIQLNDPQPNPEDLIDMNKHLNNLSFIIWNKMEVTNTQEQPTVVPEPTVPPSPALAAASSCNTPQSGAVYRAPNTVQQTRNVAPNKATMFCRRPPRVQGYPQGGQCLVPSHSTYNYFFMRRTNSGTARR